MNALRQGIDTRNCTCARMLWPYCSLAVCVCCLCRFATGSAEEVPANELLVVGFKYAEVSQEICVPEATNFRVTTDTERGQLRAFGRVGRVHDGHVNLTLTLNFSERDGRREGISAERQLRLGEFSDRGVGAHGSSHIIRYIWVRRGVDPIPTLVKTLHRLDGNAVLAARELGHLRAGARAAVPDLMEILLRKDLVGLRETVAVALGQIGPVASDAIPALVKELDSKPPDDLRVAAAAALWKISKYPHAAPILIGALRDSERRDDRLHALDALCEMGVAAPTAGSALLPMLEETDPELRAHAAETLWATTKDERALDTLMAMQARDKVGHAFAADALGRIGFPDASVATKALASRAMSDDSDVRAVAKALTRIDPDASQTVPAVVEVLRQRDGQGVTEASEVLAFFGPIVLPQLRELLDSEDAHVRDLAFAALWKIGTPAVDTLAEALRHPRTDVRRSAASRLRNAGGRKDFHALAAVPELVRALGDDDQQVRTQASFALRNVGPAAATAVKQALTDPNPRTRELAQRILSHVEPSADDP